MKTLTYWHAPIVGDSNAYDIRATTKREAKKLVADNSHNEYGPVTKVTVEYENAFDLVLQCTEEGRLGWEAQAPTRTEYRRAKEESDALAAR